MVQLLLLERQILLRLAQFGEHRAVGSLIGWHPEHRASRAISPASIRYLIGMAALMSHDRTQEIEDALGNWDDKVDELEQVLDNQRTPELPDADRDGDIIFIIRKRK